MRFVRLRDMHRYVMLREETQVIKILARRNHIGDRVMPD